MDDGKRRREIASEPVPMTWRRQFSGLRNANKAWCPNHSHPSPETTMRNLRFSLVLAGLTASSAPLTGQLLAPKDIPGYAKLVSLKGLVGFDNPRISPDGR